MKRFKMKVTFTPGECCGSDCKNKVPRDEFFCKKCKQDIEKMKEKKSDHIIPRGIKICTSHAERDLYIPEH